VGDHIFSYAQAILAGSGVNCPESPETVVEDRREIGTTYAFAPPRVFENMLTLTMVRMEDASALKRRVFKFFIDHANRVGERILNGEQGRLGLGPLRVEARRHRGLWAPAEPLRASPASRWATRRRGRSALRSSASIAPSA
jgi:hypothetical protein